VPSQKLDSIVRISPLNDLQCWVDANPCQVGALASSIVRALEFCPYALPVLARLGSLNPSTLRALSWSRSLSLTNP